MRTTGLMLVACLLVFPSVVAAGGRPPDADINFEFTYLAPGGQGQIGDFTVRWYPLTLTMPPPNPAFTIDYLEYDVVGLSHGNPADLNLFVLDPQGAGIEVMDDAGDSIPIVNTRALFTDFWGLGQALPHAPMQQIASYPPTIYLPDGPGMFTDYAGELVGTLPWIAVVIDDNPNGIGGTFQSLTLRGIAVPEPVTLTLLAIGAVAVLRKRR